MLTDENYADIAKWKAAIAHSQAPIKNILIEAVKDETKDVLTDAYFTAANKFYIAVSTEYKNGGCFRCIYEHSWYNPCIR